MQGNLSEILQRLGRDSALPGVDLCIELLQELRTDLMGGGSVRDVIDAAVIEPKRLGRPLGKHNKGGVNGWSNDPAERSREMKRRQAVSRAKKEKPNANHPRDPRHPGHAAWVEKMRKANKASWAKMTPEARAERAAKAAAGRAA